MHTVWVRVSVPGRKCLFVCGLYLPPPGSDFWQGSQLEDVLAELQALPTVLAPIVRIRKEELN